jgi:hypothetical protein
MNEPAQIYHLKRPDAKRDLPIYPTDALLIDVNENVYASCVWQIRFDLPFSEQVHCWLWQRDGDDFWQRSYRCERCGHEWIARSPRNNPGRRKAGEPPKPRQCPKCKSAWWDVPPKT